MKTEFVGTFNLDGGERVWLVSRPTKMPPLKAHVSRSRFFHGKTQDDVRGPRLRAIVFGTEPDGSRVVYDCPVENPQVE